MIFGFNLGNTIADSFVNMPQCQMSFNGVSGQRHRVPEHTVRGLVFQVVVIYTLSQK